VALLPCLPRLGRPCNLKRGWCILTLPCRVDPESPLRPQPGHLSHDGRSGPAEIMIPTQTQSPLTSDSDPKLRLPGRPVPGCPDRAWRLSEQGCRRCNATAWGLARAIKLGGPWPDGIQHQESCTAGQDRAKWFIPVRIDAIEFRSNFKTARVQIIPSTYGYIRVHTGM
jgi:hypothetical protein